uniref:Uncharacterized protein n=1 Tax=Trichogramma kaykai TaxID=54128 RepID=A0ABD2WAT1_9HYME
METSDIILDNAQKTLSLVRQSNDRDQINAAEQRVRDLRTDRIDPTSQNFLNYRKQNNSSDSSEGLSPEKQSHITDHNDNNRLATSTPNANQVPIPAPRFELDKTRLEAIYENLSLEENPIIPPEPVPTLVDGREINKIILKKFVDQIDERKLQEDNLTRSEVFHSFYSPPTEEEPEKKSIFTKYLGQLKQYITFPSKKLEDNAAGSLPLSQNNVAGALASKENKVAGLPLGGETKNNKRETSVIFENKSLLSKDVLTNPFFNIHNNF